MNRASVTKRLEKLRAEVRPGEPPRLQISEIVHVDWSDEIGRHDWPGGAIEFRNCLVMRNGRPAASYGLSDPWREPDIEDPRKAYTLKDGGLWRATEPGRDYPSDWPQGDFDSMRRQAAYRG